MLDAKSFSFAALVKNVFVMKGESVVPGQKLMEVEVVKTSLVLRADRAGVVKELLVKSGDALAPGEIVLQLDTAERSHFGIQHL